jgi:hypothetical protein
MAQGPFIVSAASFTPDYCLIEGISRWTITFSQRAPCSRQHMFADEALFTANQPLGKRPAGAIEN